MSTTYDKLTSKLPNETTPPYAVPGSISNGPVVPENAWGGWESARIPEGKNEKGGDPWETSTASTMKGVEEPAKPSFEEIGRESLGRLRDNLRRFGRVAVIAVGAVVEGGRALKKREDPGRLGKELFIRPEEEMRDIKARHEGRMAVEQAEYIAAKAERAGLKDEYDNGKKARADKRIEGRRALEDLSKKRKLDKGKLSGLREPYDVEGLQERVDSAEYDMSVREEAYKAALQEVSTSKDQYSELERQVEEFTGDRKSDKFIELEEGLARAEKRVKNALAERDCAQKLVNCARERKAIREETLLNTMGMEIERLKGIKKLKEAAVARKQARRETKQEIRGSYAEDVKEWFKTGLKLFDTTRLGRFVQRQFGKGKSA